MTDSVFQWRNINVWREGGELATELWHARNEGRRGVGALFLTTAP